MNTIATKCYKALTCVASSVIIVYRKVAGLVMQGLKKIWNNWQWVLPVGALLLSAFTWYYKTSTETPARIAACEKHLQEHITSSQSEIQELKDHINKVDLLVVEIKTMLVSIDKDLTIIKSWIVEKHQ
jgi:hypothetical protein